MFNYYILPTINHWVLHNILYLHVNLLFKCLQHLHTGCLSLVKVLQKHYNKYLILIINRPRATPAPNVYVTCILCIGLLPSHVIEYMISLSTPLGLYNSECTFTNIPSFPVFLSGNSFLHIHI